MSLSKISLCWLRVLADDSRRLLSLEPVNVFLFLVHEASQFPCVDLSCSFQDMIHIADTKVERRYGDFFIRQIHKFDEVRQTESVNLQLPLEVFQLHISIPDTSME